MSSAVVDFWRLLFEEPVDDDHYYSDNSFIVNGASSADAGYFM